MDDSSLSPTFNLEETGPSVSLAGCWRMVTDVWHEYRVPAHHLVLIESGQIEAETPTGRLRAAAGDLLCFRPTDRNAFGNCGPTLFYQAVIRFAPPPRHRDTPLLPGVGPLPVHVPLNDAFDEMRQVFETLCVEVARSDPAAVLRVQSAVYKMLAIAATATVSHPSRPNHVDAWERVRLRLVSVPTHQDDKPVRIHELARQMGVSVQHFLRMFKARLGVSPKAYRTAALLDEAARQLRGTDRSIKSIAYGLGFEDPKGLSRAIKRHWGITPSDLRQSPAAPVGTGDATSQSAGDRAASAWAGRLYPMNRHLVPPKAPVDWIQDYRINGTGPIYPEPAARRKRLQPESLPP